MPRQLDVILAVAVGGAVGSVARLLLDSSVQSRSLSLFPVGILVVNAVGCLLMGILTQVTTSTGILPPAARALLTTGFCGGFTTFSTFAHDSVQMMEAGEWRGAGLNVGVSTLVGLSAFWIGAIAAQTMTTLLRSSRI